MKMLKPTHLFICILVVFILTFYTGNFLSAGAVSKRSELNSRISDLKKEISTSKNEIESLGAKKKNLQEQIDLILTEIAQVERLIVTTQSVLQEIAIEIPKTEAKIVEVENKIYDIYKEIQYLSTTSKLELVLSSSNFGDMITNVYGLSNAQAEADRLQKDLEFTLDQLKNQKQAQEDLLNSQQSSKYLLASKKSGLDQLISETQNKQEEYEKKVKEQEEYRARTQTELDNLPPDVKTFIFNNGGNPNGGGGYAGPCYFTDSRELNYPAGYFAQPTVGSWTDNYGCQTWSWSWRQAGHDGIDIANAIGTPIVATAPGVVVGSQRYADGANGLMIRHDLPSGQKVYSIYWHLNKLPVVKVGDTVQRGQYVGEMGTTGFSTGPHLHFTIVSDTFDSYGFSCATGSRRARCYDPARLIGW